MYNLIKRSMKKLTFIVAFTLMVNAAFSVGLLTNTNQSAQFIRMMSRNASLDVDAVYYNPAGLIKLDNGWHFSVNNQTIMQTKNIDSKFPLLNDGKYQGDVFAPVFPTAFAVYKKDKWAFSFGFGPNAGGGTATFKKGLPSFEIPISKLPAGLAALSQIDPALAVSGYDVDLSFDGSSVFWGIQLGVTYEVSEMFSGYLGVRYLPAKNTYIGSIKNIQVKTGDGYHPASAWLGQASGIVSGKAQQVQALANMPETLSPFLATGGTYTLAQLVGAGALSAQQQAGIEGGLLAMGLQQGQIDAMDLNTIHGAYVQASPTFQETANLLNTTAASLTANGEQLGDKEVDVTQTGAGFTPIVGINISPNENLNIGLKYEHKTTLNLTNEFGEKDNYGEVVFGKNGKSDIPGIISAGIGYTDNYWFEAQLSYNMTFDKGIDWGSNIRNKAKREIDHNSYDIGLGLQFNITDKFSVSAGGSYNNYGIADSYQSDFSYANSSKAVGGGIMWRITDQLTLDAGISSVFYDDSKVEFIDADLGTNGNYAETYSKSTLDFAIGLSYSIFK